MARHLRLAEARAATVGQAQADKVAAACTAFMTWLNRTGTGGIVSVKQRPEEETAVVHVVPTPKPPMRYDVCASGLNQSFTRRAVTIPCAHVRAKEDSNCNLHIPFRLDCSYRLLFRCTCSWHNCTHSITLSYIYWLQVCGGGWCSKPVLMTGPEIYSIPLTLLTIWTPG
jgi:hypothetical protein